MEYLREKEANFLNSLRTEILATQERRAEYVRRKFVFVIGLLGVGSISIGSDVKTLNLLYLAPIVSFAFDLYIVGEDFNIKRAGGFLKSDKSQASESEKEWEQFARENRDPFSKIAGPLLSGIVFLAAATQLWQRNSSEIIFWLWIPFCVVFFSWMLLSSHFLKLQVQDTEPDGPFWKIYSSIIRISRGTISSL